MKILRVRLQNLNSLRGEHEIDFSAEPLSGAGLFAITGPTGAGKSTLLDAITLALYGRAARYGSTPSPEDMMSRHCGQCQAEVEFEVPAGTYRSVWQLRRARGKPDGALQAAKRFIYDASGTPLAQNIREADERIESLVGLDYDRFLRSVLLAQGEFARFLKANADDRAALLESLTGTVIYSNLSVLAHSEATRRENELAARETALGQVVLLSDEQRAQNQTQIAAYEAELAKQRTGIAELNRQIAAAQELRNNLTQEARQLAEIQKLEARRQAAQPELARLVRHRLTIPFADALNCLDTAIQHADEAKQKLQNVTRDHEQARHQWITALVGACDFAKTLVARETTALDEARRQHTLCADLKQQTQAWLTGHAADQRLESELPELLTQLDRLENGRKELAQARGKINSLLNKSQSQEQALKLTLQTQAEVAQVLEVRQKEKSEADGSLVRLLGDQSETEREKQLEEHRVRGEAIRKLQDLQTEIQQLRTTLTSEQNSLAELKPRIATATADCSRALEIKDQGARELALRQDHLNKAKLVASFADHRAALKPGETCPLCGATEHPFADPAATAVSFTDIEAGVRNAEAALKTADNNLRHAETTFTTLSHTETHLAQTTERHESDFKSKLKHFRSLAQENRLEPEADLAEVAQTNQSRITECKQQLERIKVARQEAQKAQTEFLKTESALVLSRETQSHQENALADLQKQIQECLEQAEQTNQKAATAAGLLAQALESYHLTLPEPDAEQTVRDTLRNRKNTYHNKTEELRRCVADLDKTQREVEKLTNSLADLNQRTSPLREQLATCSDLAASVDPKVVHTLRSGWKTLVDAETALRQCEGKVGKAAAAVEQRHRDLGEASTLQENIRATLIATLVGSSFSTEDEVRAARLNDPDFHRLDDLERDLQSKSDHLTGSLQSVRATIQRMRSAQVLEGEALAASEGKLHAAQTSIEQVTGNIATLRHDLQRDDAARTEHAQRTAELQEQRKRLQLWQQLRALIGSHDGRKFRRFAQGISLDILAHHANAHLHRLSDRYRLLRRGDEELELEIEDLYQAGARRPMASLSGGESFLGSLALALGLADLAGRNVRIDTLFIDEGFGSLDADTLDLAISALETLRADRKVVGVISHVDLLKERIATQIVVEKRSAGTSSLRIIAF